MKRDSPLSSLFTCTSLRGAWSWRFKTRWPDWKQWENEEVFGRGFLGGKRPVGNIHTLDQPSTGEKTRISSERCKTTIENSHWKMLKEAFQNRFWGCAPAQPRELDRKGTVVSHSSLQKPYLQVQRNLRTHPWRPNSWSWTYDPAVTGLLFSIVSWLVKTYSNVLGSDLPFIQSGMGGPANKCWCPWRTSIHVPWSALTPLTHVLIYLGHLCTSARPNFGE